MICLKQYGKFVGLLLGVWAALAAQISHAQTEARPNFNRVLNLDNRLTPQGVKIGDWLVLPTLRNQVQYDDNATLRRNDAKVGQSANVTGGALVISQLPRHEVSIEAVVSRDQFLNNSTLNRSNALTTVRGRLDIGAVGALTAEAGLEHRERVAGERDSIVISRGINEENNYRLGLRADFKPSAFGYNVSANYARNKVEDFRFFDDIIVENPSNTNNDSSVYSLNGTLSYEFSPGYNSFVNIGMQKIDFDDAFFLERDNIVYSIFTGLNSSERNVISGKLSAGYQTRRFSSNQIANNNIFALDTSLVWRFSTIASLIGTLSRNTNQISSPDFVNFVDNALSLTLISDALRNARFQLGTRAVDRKTDFSNGVRQTEKDRVYAFFASVEYRLTPNIAIVGDIVNQQRQSQTNPGREFDRNVITLGVSLGL
jgi:hypothetical protein